MDQKQAIHAWINNQTDVSEENAMSTQSQITNELSNTIRSIEKEFEELERKTMSLTPLCTNKHNADSNEFNEHEDLSIKCLEAEELIRRDEINKVKRKQEKLKA